MTAKEFLDSGGRLPEGLTYDEGSGRIIVGEDAEAAEESATVVTLLPDVLMLKATVLATSTTEDGSIRAEKNAAGHDVETVTHVTLTGKPGSITQRISAKGGVERNYYGSDGKQTKQVANNDHGNPKEHPYGKHGEHVHDYVYDENGKLIGRPRRDLDDEELEENGDIL